jgi:hypothetical protein
VASAPQPTSACRCLCSLRGVTGAERAPVAQHKVETGMQHTPLSRAHVAVRPRRAQPHGFFHRAQPSFDTTTSTTCTIWATATMDPTNTTAATSPNAILTNTARCTHEARCAGQRWPAETRNQSLGRVELLAAEPKRASRATTLPTLMEAHAPFTARRINNLLPPVLPPL